MIFLTIILPLLSLFSAIDVYAQGGTGDLPGSKPTPTPKPPSMSSTGDLPGAKPTPTPKPTTKVAKPAPVIITLNVGEEKNGRLDPADKGADGSFFQEINLLNAKSEDLLSFRIESDNPSLGLQILDKTNAEVAVGRDASGDFKITTPTGGLPADGDYRLRVTSADAGKNAISFTIKAHRLGLTAIVYAERFNKIFTSYRKDDPASVEETLAKLEELGRDTPSRPTAFEMLGIIYLEVRKDFVKAGVAMEQAIKANGVAVIQISFDTQWRRMAKLRSGEFGFEETRSGWLKIGAGQLTITDLSGKALGTLSKLQIKQLSKTLVAAYSMVTIVADNTRKPYIFAPKTKQQAEVDLVINLIQNHVMGQN
jgi:hypothetical protein